MLLFVVCFLKPAGAAGAQVVHAQQRAVAAAASPAEVVAIATGQGVRAVTQVTASAVVSTTLSPVQSQPRPLVAQVPAGTLLTGRPFQARYGLTNLTSLPSFHPATGMQLSQGKSVNTAHLQMLRQQQLQQHQQQQQQAASPQMKTVGKPQVHHQHFST